MINGPGNVWVERAGRLTEHQAAPDLDGAVAATGRYSYRPAFGAGPGKLPNSRCSPGRRLAGGDLCSPRESSRSPSPCAGLGSVLFRRMISSTQGALPGNVRAEAERVLRSRRNILVSGGTGSGKTAASQCAHRTPTGGRAHCRHRGHVGASHRAVKLRALRGSRGLREGAVTIRDLVRHALRHRPDHIVVGEVRGGEAADLLQALNTGHGGSLTTVHANNAESALSRIASCAMQGGGELPWEVTCRGVVDGIAMVIHMTRREGRRFVEEAVFVKGYEAAGNRWFIEPVWPRPGASEPPGEARDGTLRILASGTAPFHPLRSGGPARRQ